MAFMRAVWQESLGGPDVLEVVEIARPEPGPTEVLVQVAAAGVNPVDWKTRADGGFLDHPPFTVGCAHLPARAGRRRARARGERPHRGRQARAHTGLTASASTR